MNIDFNQYLAKPNKSIQEHAADLLSCLDLLICYNYIEDEKLIKLVREACIHHDDGKVNDVFQRRIRTNERFNESIEVAHQVLSVYLLDKNQYDDTDYLCVAFAIMYHYAYGNPYNEATNKKELIRLLLNQFEYEHLSTRKLISICQKMNDPCAIKIKGYLHRCDHSASGNYQVEYPNDFLKESLNNVKEKWKKIDVHSDWNELQQFAIAHSNQNVMMIAQTGMGKTEASLHWIGNHKGYIVLPTRAAINAMYERIAEHILNKQNIDEKIAILHSESILYYLDNMDIDEDVSEYEARGKRFSIPLSISTMDQMFDFIFKYRGYEEKLITFSYSKIVIDEIQMYDSKRLAYIVQGLKMIGDFGGKIAIVTATLSPFMKDILKEEIGFEDSCVATFTNDLIRHSVKTIDQYLNAGDILNLYEKNNAKDLSNKILVVCNSIGMARNLYKDIKSVGFNDVFLLHSLYTKEDRLHKEKDIVSFGKTYNDDRSIHKQSGIWITTSIVEASLDIDFDYLFTELNDLNSLFQRMGRCNRKGVKVIDDYNCYIYLKNIKSKGEPIINKLSKDALKHIDGVITEKQKMELIETYFTMENIEDSNYYREYKETLSYLKRIGIYVIEKESSVLSDLSTVNVIPYIVFMEHQNEILNASKALLNKNRSHSDYYKFRNQILKYSVNINYGTLKKCKDKPGRYQEIKLGYHEKISIVDCNYDELGFWI